MDDFIQVSQEQSVPIKTSNVQIRQDIKLKDSEEEIVEENGPINYKMERVPSGIIGLDELIAGGFEKNSTILIAGAVGTGKTLLSLQYLYKGAAEYDEPGVFISFEEDRESLYRHCAQFGFDFEKLEKEKKFRLLEFKPHQMTKIIQEGGGNVRDILRDLGAKRVVIDSITAYGLLFKDEYKRRDKVLEFFNALKKWEVTALVISEESPERVESQVGSIGFIADSIVSLYYQHDEERGIRVHSLEVVKMRGTKHTNKLLAMNFENNGIKVYPDVEVF